MWKEGYKGRKQRLDGRLLDLSERLHSQAI